MSDIVQFLRTRLDEDQATADAAAKEKPAPWREHHGDVLDATGAELIGSVGYGGAIVPPYVDEHIARQNPARTLRDVQADREILAMYETTQLSAEVADGTPLAGAARLKADTLRRVLMARAGQWSDHPDFDPSWSVTA